MGQEVIIKTLSQALLTGRIAHAFLLTGSRGVGKTTVARLLAKALCCEKGISPNPCGSCSHCLEISSGNSLDIIEIDGASNTGVDDVRELRETLRYQPSSARFKIFIIDEVHMLSTSAFNALLKTLEEPPPHVKFVFATTEAHKIPITILSRCQRYDFKRIPIATITKNLKQIIDQENIQVDSEGLLLIAQNADGGMRDALSLLDQVISFSGTQVSQQDIIEILGLIDQKNVQKLANALIDGDSNTALSILDSTYNSGHDLKQLSDLLALEMRNLCIAATTGSIAGLADLTEEQIRTIDEKSKQSDPLDLQRLFSGVIQMSNQLALSEQPKLVLELAFMKMAQRPKLVHMTEVMKAIERLESIDSASQLAPSTTRPTSFKQFVDRLALKMPLIAAHLHHARILEDNTLEFDNKIHFSQVKIALQEKEFQDLFQAIFHTKPEVTLSKTLHENQVSLVKKEQETLEQKARNHPTIQKALSMFGGEIKAVRKIDNSNPDPHAE